ncbi:MAG: CHAT domain-containing protein [Acidobacteriota bacterium]|nr:CHAT domain-containing protein [Acidobacteriota bacterium]
MLSLLVFASAQSDEATLRAIVGKYYEAYTRNDWEAFSRLWHERSPALAARANIWQQQAANFDFKFTEPVISRLKIINDLATLRVAVRRTMTQKNSATRNITEVRAELSFLRVNGEWKLLDEASAVGELLNALTGARTDDERRLLLDEDKELVTRELLFMLNSQSDRAYAQGDHTRALSLLQSAILVAERLGDRNELSDAWHKAGIIHFLQKRYDAALIAYRKSLAIEEASGRPYEIARSFSSIALVELSQNKFPEALAGFGRALAVYETLDKKSDVIQTLENIGNVYYEQGDFPHAIEIYQRCIQLYDANKQPRPAAQHVLKLAQIQFEQGHDAAAVALYRQAAERLAAAGDRRSLGYAFHSAANILYEQGDYNQALGLYQRSRQAERAAGTREGESGALQGIGLIHSLNGNYALALPVYEQNLEVARAIKDKAGVATAWQKVGGAHFSLGKYDDALTAYKESLALREQLGDAQDTALSLLDVGVTLGAKQDYVAALERYGKSRALYEQANNPVGVAAALLNTAFAHYQQNDFVKTLEVAEQAAQYAQRGEDLDLFWQARHRAGRAYFQLNDLALARNALTEAITTIETMRPQTSRSQQPRFFESKISPYLAMVDVAIGEGLGNEAFNFAERARTRVLTGVLQNAKTQIVKTMTAREQQRERQLLGQITIFNAQLYREQERDKPSAARIGVIKAQLQKAQAEYADFRTKLYALRPQLKLLRGELKPAVVEQAARLIPNTKTALLEFVETDERVYLFVFTKQQAKSSHAKVPVAANTNVFPSGPSGLVLKIFALGTNRADLFARVSNFNQAISKMNSQLPNANLPDATLPDATLPDATLPDATLDAQARELYDLLLKEARPALKGKTQLMIAPDAVSWSLPFAALRNEEQRYLIEDFAIAYTPSLTVFSAIVNTRITPPVPNRAGTRVTPPASLFAVANPALGQNALELLKTSLQTAQEPLTEAEKGVAELAKLYGAQRSVTLTGAEASEDRIKAEIGRHRFTHLVIHLAAPGVHHEASPLFSLLAFAPSPENKDGNGTEENGLLDLRELLRLNLNADLVVLQASEWAKPRTVSNRAMTAWAWAWLVAGSRSTLISNWRVESPCITQAMLELHRQINTPRTNPTKAAAWRAAVLKLLEQEEYRHPYFWAGFAMVGDGK